MFRAPRGLSSGTRPRARIDTSVSEAASSGVHGFLLCSARERAYIGALEHMRGTKELPLEGLYISSARDVVSESVSFHLSHLHHRCRGPHHCRPARHPPAASPPRPGASRHAWARPATPVTLRRDRCHPPRQGRPGTDTNALDEMRSRRSHVCQSLPMGRFVRRQQPTSTWKVEKRGT
jgi:hypothetical protein